LYRFSLLGTLCPEARRIDDFRLTNGEALSN
jgi:hypothetical protein